MRAFILALLVVCSPALARDNGQWANSPLKPWFDALANKNGGLCCSFADGITLTDVQWNMQEHYRVEVWGQWYDVPEEAVVAVPNKYGQAVVWPYFDADGKVKIRCFMPGAGT